MARLIAQYYMLAMLMIFGITLWAGAQGQSMFEIFSIALLAWPGAFFVMLARHRAARIMAHVRHQD